MRRNLAVLLGLSALVGLTLPAAGEEIWVNTANQDCQVLGDAPLNEDEQVTWSGNCIDGRATGLGVLEWTLGGEINGIYDGTMANGQPHGDGVLRLRTSDGAGFDRLEAVFVNGKADGEVRYDSPDGGYFNGNLKNGIRHGLGFYRESNGTEYLGDFENGKHHGFGMLTDAEGNSYFGEFEEGAGKGDGVFEGADGSTFQGQFENSMPHGFGTLVAPNGDVYQGQFVGGKPNGLMLVTSVDGSQSTETWKDGVNANE